MNDNIDFDTYLFVSLNKLIISVHHKSDFKKIYRKELTFKVEKQLNFIRINDFLDKNIFKIEKLFKNFVKKISVIIDTKNFFLVKISIKKNNHENSVDISSLSYLLNEAKISCKKTIADRKIIHMIIDRYRINDDYYSNMPQVLQCKNFSLDVSFICLSNDLIYNFEKILKKYQISLNQIISADYAATLSNDGEDIFDVSKNILDGYNQNEIMLVKKIHKNKGFFEKFFNFFG
jgi:hypothetical protein